jgi:hypothetical protein
MPNDDRSKQIQELTEQSANLLLQLMTADDDTDKKAAADSYRDVLALIGTYSIANYEGRTSLLTDLIAQLNAVKQSVQVSNKVADQIAALDPLITKAQELFESDTPDQ